MKKINSIQIALYIAIIGVIGLSSYIFTVVSPRYTEFLVANTEKEAIRAANYINSILFENSAAQINKKSIANIDTSLIDRSINHLGIRKLRLFSPSGEVVFSTENIEIGTINKKDYFFEFVAKGFPYTKTVIKNEKTAEGQLAKVDVVESYVPIFNQDKFSGAFEVYYDISDRKAELKLLVNNIYWTILPFSLALLMLIILVSRKANKSYDQLHQTELLLKASHENMEKTVLERTEELKRSNIQLEKESEERKKYTEEMLLSASVFENAVEAIMITDHLGNIQKINKAFTEITGFEEDEIIGMNPRIKKSDRHDEAFYQKMWQSLQENGTWKGEIWNRRKSGEIYPESLSISQIVDDENKVKNYVALFHDISDMKDKEQKLKYQANYDALTGLPNRDLFNDRLKFSMAQANRDRLNLAVMFLDLDDFKNVNDSLGHFYGDLLLKQAAERLLNTCRQEDTVARLGGDEFMIITPNYNHEDSEVVILAERLVTAFNESFQLKDKIIHINISIGIAYYPQDGKTLEELVKNADLAMYRSKGLGKNQYTFFTEEISNEVLRRIALSNDLRGAMARNEFSVVYQPKVDIQSGEISGMEALVRWKRQGKEMISPAEFIPLAEMTDVIYPLGEWVLSSACQLAKELNDIYHRDLFVAVNLSVKQFRQKNLFDLIKKVLQDTGLPARQLTIEITEGIVIENIDKTISILRSLKDMGINISIDDFGTGYSSLSYLKKLPLSELKIDKAFIDEVPDEEDSTAIVKTILNLAKSLRLKTVAEGVETQQQLNLLIDEKCDEIQGYLFSKPVNASEMKSLLLENKTLYSQAQ